MTWWPILQLPLSPIRYIPMKNNYSYSTVSDYSKQSKDTIKTITIKTTPTGTESAGNYKKSEPIKNALVRIDGVPRWTNSKG